MIELPYGCIKFKNTLIKFYFINNPVIDDDQLMPNSLTLIQSPEIEI